MTVRRFYTLLAIFTAVAVAAASAAHLLLSIDYAIPFTAGSFVLFLLVSIGMFHVGKYTAGAENKFLFTNAFMGITLLKLFLCGGIITAYAILGKPESSLFIVPFFLLYLIYTMLEIVFLLKVARETSGKATE